MLSKETIERIEKDAVIKYYKGNRSLTATFLQEGYIAGATAEATRYEQERKELMDGIEFFLNWLKEKRPSLCGLGAPIMLLQELLSKHK